MSDLFSAPEKECCDGKGKVLSLIKVETTRFTLLCSFIVCFHIITNQFHLFLTYHEIWSYTAVSLLPAPSCSIIRLLVRVLFN